MKAPSIEKGRYAMRAHRRFLIMTFLGGFMYASPADTRFEDLAARYIKEFPALSPVGATWLGDHRFDGELDQVSPEARAAEAAFLRAFLDALTAIPRGELSRANQVDHALLENRLRAALWELLEHREWSWNPLAYTRLSGGAIYSLVAREFAPLPERLSHLADRLEQFPRLFAQIRATLIPALVPPVHAQTAARQNSGVLQILDAMVAPHMDALPAATRARLQKAMDAARAAVKEHQAWLENELLPAAAGEFRLGPERFDQKLAWRTSLSRAEIRALAEEELSRAREKMYAIAKEVYAREYPYTEFPDTPSRATMQAVIRAALELAYQDLPEPDALVEAARASLALAADFVRARDIVTVPPDPLEIIVMPEFRRGIALAYCDAPGPLDVGQKTFYAVSPPPADWTPEQLRSFLREYNTRSIHNLTIHEAMPGHFLQLVHSNRYPSVLRSVLSSGVFIEGWAVYGERVMMHEGFLDGDPLMRLIVLKWYLRAVANAILDQRIHCEGMAREEALRLMIEDTFQEEREAAGKWTRAQLTSVQLSTYFVGYIEHARLREEVETAWGPRFALKRYHDALLSFGSPPVKYVRALLLDLPVP